MYGSIMRARIKSGRKDEYVRLLQEVVPSAEDYGQGLHSLEIAFEDKDPNGVVLIIHFRDRESYVRNANRPETNADWERQAALLDDVQWIDVSYESYVGKPVGGEETTRA